MFSKIFRPRNLLLVLLLILVAALTYGFAATLTPSGDDVAAGSSAVMTNMAADVTWSLNATTPDTGPTATLNFTSGTPTTVYAQVQDVSQAALTVTSGDAWVSCSPSGANFVCVFPGVSVASIYYIRIAAAE